MKLTPIAACRRFFGYDTRMTRRRLKDRAIVIVGGTAGLGLSAARACLAAGARVVVSGRDADVARQAGEQLGPSAVAVVRDAADPASAPALIETCLANFRGFDAMYHVAGGSGRRQGDGPLHQITDDGWHATLQLNLTSCFHSARAACRTMLERNTPGSILLMGSVLGFSPSPRHFATHAYAATKSAVIGFAKSCAAYYASAGIRFNVIAPALVETPMSQRAAADADILRFIAAKQPLDGGRIGRPDDLDGAVLWLLSDESKCVTGQTIVVDGGWSVSDTTSPDLPQGTRP
ncbi:MAG: SDR family oxidoreductase [Phycisphaeraceae bacterium]